MTRLLSVAVHVFTIRNQLLISLICSISEKEKYNTALNLDLSITQRLDFITEGLSLGVKGGYDTNMYIKKQHKIRIKEPSGVKEKTISGIYLTVEELANNLGINFIEIYLVYRGKSLELKDLSTV